ncbi:MAG: DUF6790 family protein [Longimicrobiales bacterium]|nr:DUF6790 family protein [Longimicrobiales bacterium]
MPAWLRQAAQWLAILIGIGFIVGGGAKLNDPARVAELFASWGLPGGGLILAAGWTEVVLGVALLNRPTRPLAAAGLAVWMVLWGSVQIAAGSAAAVASVVVLALMALYLLGRSEPFLSKDGWVESPLGPAPSPSLTAVHRIVRLVGIAFLIRWAVGGITYWLALPLLSLADPRARDDSPNGPRSRDDAPADPLIHAAAPAGWLEGVLLHLLVLGLGVSGLWSFVGHTFMSETVSRSVGWSPSPFQRELAFYHLAIGVCGIACWWIRDHFWLAAAAIPSLFLYGAGWVHLTDFLEHGNAAPANWGFSVLFGNLLLPTAILVLVWMRYRRTADS